jgi:hypothetical protein
MRAASPLLLELTTGANPSTAPPTRWMEVPPDRDHHRVEGDGSEDRGIGRHDDFRIVSRHDSARKSGPEREHDMARQRPRHEPPGSPE